VLVEAREMAWTRVGRTSFIAGPPAHFASCRWEEAGRGELLGGVDGMALLATRGSAFGGFYRDELTVQAEADDRPLSGMLSARWSFRPGEMPTREASRLVPTELATAFADRPSNAIQQLVSAAGSELLVLSPALLGVWLEFSGLPLSPLAPQLLPSHGGVRAHAASAGPVGVTSVHVGRG
jgi:urate oxidase